MRCIDLRFNQIPKLDHEFYNCLYNSDTVLNVDLRDNQHVDQEQLRKVALSLIKNIDKAK